jgi:hypothetical protein
MIVCLMQLVRNLRTVGVPDSDMVYEKYDKMIRTPPPVDEEIMKFNRFSQINEPKSPPFERNVLINPAMLSNDPDLINNMNINMNNIQQPYSNSNQNGNLQDNNLQEQYVLVPTPVDQEYFNKLKTQPGKQVLQNEEAPLFLEKNLNSEQGQFLVDSKFVNLLNTTSQTQAFEEVLNSSSNNKKSAQFNNEKIEKLISKQEKDYEKYFDEINKIEYQKVYQSLNNQDEGKIYQSIMKADEAIDYGKAFDQNLNISNLNYTSDLVINLPQNAKEMQATYNNLFQKEFNVNNSISLLQESNLNKVEEERGEKVQMHGHVDSKVRPTQHDLIGFANKEDVHEKDYPPKGPNAEDLHKEVVRKEMEKRGKETFPRFKRIRPHEAKDNEEKEYKLKQKEKEFQELKKRIEGTSFIQQLQLGNLSPELLKDKQKLKELLIKSLNKEGMFTNNNNNRDNIIEDKENLKKKVRLDLAHCQGNCNNTCKRVAQFKKDETEQLCKLKCQIACSNNALNTLLK